MSTRCVACVATGDLASVPKVNLAMLNKCACSLFVVVTRWRRNAVRKTSKSPIKFGKVS